MSLMGLGCVRTLWGGPSTRREWELRCQITGLGDIFANLGLNANLARRWAILSSVEAP